MISCRHGGSMAEEKQHYLALYRKYRPGTFEDVRGRDAIVRTLQNQIVAGRIGHSYLFCGTRGTGKTTIAKIFAKAVNCEDPRDGSPCGKCGSCRAIEQNANLNVVEMDAASNNGVEDVRNIIDSVGYSPTSGKYRVYIIDEVHMLSTQAFNALLKTLEEPPSYAIFILATTEPNKLPMTILSRCQRYDFGRLSSAVIAGRLQEVCTAEGIRTEEKALKYIAAAADGSMRDALSLLDQCNAFNYGEAVLSYKKTLEILGALDTEVFHRLAGMLHAGDAAGALKILEEILVQGRELTQFVTDFVWYLRNMMLLKASEAISDMIDMSEENLERLLEDARRAEMTEIMRAIRILSLLSEQIRYAANRRILTEMALIRLCTPAMDPGAAGMEAGEAEESTRERIRILEEKVLADQEILSGIAEGTLAVNAAEPVKKEPPKLERAVPEDVRSVVANWSRLLAGIPAGYLKAALQKAGLSLGEKGELLIVFGNRLCADHFIENQLNREELENYLQERTGKKLSIEYKYLDKGRKFKDNYVDLQDVIKMDIQTED